MNHSKANTETENLNNKKNNLMHTTAEVVTNKAPQNNINPSP